MHNQKVLGLTEAEIQQYWQDGFLVFDDIISMEEVEELRAACEKPQILALRSQQDYETKTVHALGITSLHPIFLHLANHPSIVEKIKALLGPDIQLQHSKLATKPPSRGVGVFPWHQDYAFYPHTNTDLLSVMVMLDDATPETGCMSMTKGSHKLGILNHEVNGSFVAACQESQYWTDSAYEVVAITPRTGGISIHHALTLHGSEANQSGKPRRGLVFSYRSDDSQQLADAIFDDTGLLICGSNQGVVRCDVGLVRLPNRGGDTPFGPTWNQIGSFALEENKKRV
jgi:phytanoyl-CoA hydroxylase